MKQVSQRDQDTVQAWVSGWKEVVFSPDLSAHMPAEFEALADLTQDYVQKTNVAYRIALKMADHRRLASSEDQDSDGGSARSWVAIARIRSLLEDYDLSGFRWFAREPLNEIICSHDVLANSPEDFEALALAMESTETALLAVLDRLTEMREHQKTLKEAKKP